MPALADSVARPSHPAGNGAAAAARTLALQRALLRDPVVRRRILQQAELRRAVLQSTEGLTAAEQAEVRRLLTPERPRR